MIERWFPCDEVSSNSDSGWGSGNAERNLFTWFAARPAAQAKAAVICSLLPWPDEEAEQARLQALVRDAMTGRYARWNELRTEIARAHPGGVSVLDPFSGRGMIPLEAARLGVSASAMDYSPVAVLASELLADYPFRDWSAEPALPFHGPDRPIPVEVDRLIEDVELFLAEVGTRFYASLAELYPGSSGTKPWGYLWAVTLPCQECGRRFPLVGSYELRKPGVRRGKGGRPDVRDIGQSFYVDTDGEAFRVVVHDGSPKRPPTLSNAVARDGKPVKGKSATCPFCGHVHPIGVHQRLAGSGLGRDTLLAVVESHPVFGRQFREPTHAEVAAAESAEAILATEKEFSPLLPAVPSEQIPLNNGATIRPQLYGARSYGDLMVPRQTLAFVRLSRAIGDVTRAALEAGISRDYAHALSGYACAVMVRMLKFSTRGAKMRSTPGAGLVDHIFSNEGTIAFSYDFFEVGLSDGPGSWPIMADGTHKTLTTLRPQFPGVPVSVTIGTAASEPYRDGSITAVVTDPPYDSMVYYSDSSDLFFAWLKRALAPFGELEASADSRGLQDKTDEIIVKEHGKAPDEHRTRSHYDARIAKAFSEMRRVVHKDGLVTIVFGHGEPEVWQRLLGAIGTAGLVMTGSWPARTESGGQQGKANIETTLTMACRPAGAHRPEGRKAAVEAEIRAAIKGRYLDWERWGLAPTDMLMAAAGPAMEAVGRYSVVRDARGEPVDVAAFLPLARGAVQEAMALEIDDHPLATFDARTRFALWWVRLYGKQVVAKSELRWQALASSLDLADVRDLVRDADKGCRFISSSESSISITPTSAVIDVVFAVAKAIDNGLEAVGEVLVASGRDPEDAFLWASVKFLADRLPDSDPDAIAWTRLLRNRGAIGSAVHAAASARADFNTKRKADDDQLRLF